MRVRLQSGMSPNQVAELRAANRDPVLFVFQNQALNAVRGNPQNQLSRVQQVETPARSAQQFMAQETKDTTVPPRHTPFSLPTAVTIPDSSQKQETVEEEPYTIKCICNFIEDDENTIYCEKCETWQHIECYYPNNLEDALRADFWHACAECEPRSLNRQLAIERMCRVLKLRRGIRK